ncbi:MAG: hypothetical protein ACSHX5_06885 [Phycisphaerales bacterium]
MKYKVRTSKGEFGPMKGKKLSLWALNGKITPNDLVRPMNQKRWYKAESVEGLFSNERVTLEGTIVAASNKRAASNSPRLLIIVLMILAPFLGLVFPAISFWTMGLFLILLGFHAVPKTRVFSNRLIRVSSDRPARGVFKVVFLWLYTGLLLLAGVGGMTAAEELKERRIQQEEAKAENLRLQQIANQTVDSLIQEAQRLLSGGSVEDASAVLSEARSVVHSTRQSQVSKLIREINRSTDPKSIYERLVRLEDGDFEAFRTERTTPASFVSEFDVLTEKTIEIANTLIQRAIPEREFREQKRLEAEEERKRLEQERIIQQEKAAEQQRKLEEEQFAAKEAQRAAAKKEIQDKLDAYIAFLELSEVAIVDSVSVKRIGDETWEATLTVENVWHIRHKQLRLQDAQALWKAWALIASPNNLDSARIIIVDQNGNEVGGSRVWGGSLIWVND